MLSIFGVAKANNPILCSKSLFEESTLKSGCLWEKSGLKSEINTLHFKVTAQQSDFLIMYEENKIIISNHLGKLRLNLRDGSEVLVPAGFQIWISEVQSNKKNSMSIIEPIDIKEHTKKLIFIWDSSLENFKKHFKPIVSKWGPNNDIASRYYKGLVERKIASLEAVKFRKLRIQQQERQIRRRNKELLFNKAFSR